MKKKIITLSLAITATLALSNCNTHTGMRPAHQDAAAGAAIGAAAGAIIGHQSGRGAEGALIGAGVGGVTGHAVGRNKEQQAGYR